MTKPYVKSSISKGIAICEFYTPNHNALPTPVLNDLEQEILSLGKNDDVRLIILQSGGDRTFCAGASFKELIAIEDEHTGKQFFMGFAKVILAIKNCNKLVIARLQGKAVGGGVGIAAAVDYCFATKYASVKLSEISIGIGPFVIAPAVERKIGVSALSQLTINAKSFYEPQWCLEKGLFHDVCDTVEEMDNAIMKLATNLASYNPKALSAIKSMFWEQTEDWHKLLEQRAKVSGTLVLSEFTKKTLQGYA